MDNGKASDGNVSAIYAIGYSDVSEDVCRTGVSIDRIGAMSEARITCYRIVVSILVSDVISEVSISGGIDDADSSDTSETSDGDDSVDSASSVASDVDSMKEMDRSDVGSGEAISYGSAYASGSDAVEINSDGATVAGRSSPNS